MSNICAACGQEIRVQIFKGSGYCCELCRKQLEREVKKDEAGD